MQQERGKRDERRRKVGWRDEWIKNDGGSVRVRESKVRQAQAKETAVDTRWQIRKP
jgi:hypothetical protein